MGILFVFNLLQCVDCSLIDWSIMIASHVFGLCSRLSLQPLQLSLQKRTTVCDSPTASGTCVPQHYATMGSFDTLMAHLSLRHPEAGRQRIVDALLELRAKHQGFLSGLPLKTIVNMTSDLLTR